MNHLPLTILTLALWCVASFAPSPAVQGIALLLASFATFMLILEES